MSVNTRAGRLRHRVTLQREVRTPDGAGGFDLDWADVGNPFWAAVEPMVGRESLEARQLESAVTHKIVCRAPRDIRTKDRILFAGRVFNIRSVLDVQERGHRLEIDAEEGVAV